MVELTTQPVEDFDVSRFGGEGFEFAGAFDVNADVVDHPAGPEQQNAVGETDGFAEVVGYEDDRPAYLRLPKLEEFSLYFDSGLRIEGGKGSSINKMSGSSAHVRANATRWRIPWESCQVHSRDASDI